MRLVTETHYRIERYEDDDGRIRRNREFEELVDRALRWRPELPGDEAQQEEFDKGVSALRQLSTSNAISAQQLERIVAVLCASIAFYEAGPWEPFEGRNAEAAQDLRNVVDVLSVPHAQESTLCGP